MTVKNNFSLAPRHTPVIPMAWEAGTGEWQVQGRPQQLSEILSQNTNNKQAGNVVQWLNAPKFNSWY